MDGDKRREQILRLLQEGALPISGALLAQKFEVSRQVIVQDVALLRAQGYDILATARGYILNKEAASMRKRVVAVKHDEGKLEEELEIIIDNGGTVRDVIIMHPVYGELVAGLLLKTRRDIKQFVDKVNTTSAAPLMQLTKGEHMHTIEAATEEELDIIEQELLNKGYIKKCYVLKDVALFMSISCNNARGSV
ncbi:DNA-binding transcriptional regulator [Sporanaerobium hydrogeniformans]|uniref:DNA-binding transcriptional regulator n=1 Tax=Sporanaerobium hydrogeniformans TaxID=3072179 RepID=A0AC61D927_9FIRM|nr:transcription repressor NadR [Sporanaerobium hydrogeniformans]PHV69280.1 DNA-binding transcriptional regulator [Sporanaerobium hydrogeniformans]